MGASGRSTAVVDLLGRALETEDDVAGQREILRDGGAPAEDIHVTSEELADDLAAELKLVPAAGQGERVARVVRDAQLQLALEELAGLGLDLLGGLLFVDVVNLPPPGPCRSGPRRHARRWVCAASGPAVFALVVKIVRAEIEQIAVERRPPRKAACRKATARSGRFRSRGS